MGESNLPLHIQVYGHTVDVLENGDFVIDGKGLPFWLAKHVESELPIDVLELRPVQFTRTLQHLGMNVNGSQVTRSDHIYAVGWQATVKIPIYAHGSPHWHEEERNVKHILYLHPDGSMVFG